MSSTTCHASSQALVLIQKWDCSLKNSMRRSLSSLKLDPVSCVPNWPCHHCPRLEILLTQFLHQGPSQAEEIMSWGNTLLELSANKCPDIKGHCHRVWITVLSCSPHTSHLGSMWTFLRQRFARVGRMSEQALHSKVRTLGGMGSFHNLFHILLSSPASKCSAFDLRWIRKATWYAERTKKVCVLFSFHTSLSRLSNLPNRVPSTSSLDGGKNQALTFSLSHCLLYRSMKSPTFSDVSTPSWKVWGLGSHLWLLMPAVPPSPMLHFDPSQSTSLALRRLH